MLFDLPGYVSGEQVASTSKLFSSKVTLCRVLTFVFGDKSWAHRCPIPGPRWPG